MKIKSKLILILLIFATVFSTVLIPVSQVSAEATLNWDKPNGPSPFKFKIKDFLNPQLLMSVVGCTGVVDKISGSIMKLVQFKNIGKTVRKMKRKIKEYGCEAIQIATATTTAVIPVGTPAAPILKPECMTLQGEDKESYQAAQESIAVEEKAQNREQCLNGIAVTLAKNQLVKMTRATLNWVTTGFNGDPMYVRNMGSLMENISHKLELKQLEMFKDSNGVYNIADYPYGREYSFSSINASQSARNPMNSLIQDLTNYLPPGVGVEDFSKDFSKGGWSGWLALTQHPQNNPIGFTQQAAQQLAKEKEAKTTATKEEANRNGGVLDQKVCKVWSTFGSKKTKGLTDNLNNLESALESEIENKNEVCKTMGEENIVCNTAKDAVAEAQQNLNDEKNKSNSTKNASRDCAKWEVVTPGSLIKDKISTYINSPERQLELAKTINDSLNLLFTDLIKKLRFNGLSSLGSGGDAYTKVSGGFSSNSLTDAVDVNGDQTSKTGGYKNDKFDLTKDLGNQYYHETMTDLGEWNAETNLTSDEYTLYIDTAPYLNNEQIAHAYYTVNNIGSTQLFRDGYNVWAVGDRAYFDGKDWQNWKKGTSNPIAKRGILQVQQDYIVVAKELLRHFPGIMPKIGELDYCIPGPNPSWQSNYADTYKVFAGFINGFKTDFSAGGFFKKPYVTVKGPSGEVYDNYKKIFNGTIDWSKITATKAYQFIYEKTHLKNKRRKGGDDIAEANKWVSDFKEKVFKEASDFSDEYKKIVDDTYGKDSPMLKQYLENEKTADLEDNPAWLPMAGDGIKITQDIVTYNEEITKSAQDYKDGIAEANLNIYKLKIIGDEVRDIVKAAQDRRDKKLEDARVAADANGSTTPVEDWIIPVMCKDEEAVDSLSSSDLLIDFTGSSKERCLDGIDNDLDGLVDTKDPDCGDTYVYDPTNNLTGESGDSCILGAEQEVSYNYNSNNYNVPCSDIKYVDQCVYHLYYKDGGLYNCNWDYKNADESDSRDNFDYYDYSNM